MNKETGEALEYNGNMDRNGYKRYSNPEKDNIILRHIKEELNEEYKENRVSEEGKELYRKRKETVERSFADSKQNHGYRYAMYRGITKNQNYTWLICAAQNMKNISIKAERYGKEPSVAVQKGSFLYNFFCFTKYTFNFFTRKPLAQKN